MDPSGYITPPSFFPFSFFPSFALAFHKLPFFYETRTKNKHTHSLQIHHSLLAGMTSHWGRNVDWGGGGEMADLCEMLCNLPDSSSHTFLLLLVNPPHPSISSPLGFAFGLFFFLFVFGLWLEGVFFLGGVSFLKPIQWDVIIII